MNHKYSLAPGGPYYCVFTGTHFMNALGMMRKENQKLMDEYEKNGWTGDDNDTKLLFWQVVTGVNAGEGDDKHCDLLCQMK